MSLFVIIIGTVALAVGAIAGDDNVAAAGIAALCMGLFVFLLEVMIQPL